MVFGFGNKSFLTHPSVYATEAKGASIASNARSYDYVIIGCGTAGSVLASRLSENPNVHVLVLEAGGDQRGILETKIPLTFSKLFHGVNDWDYYTTPQKEVRNRELYWPRGKMIGGSSSMNAMMFQTCQEDFNEWEKDLGCKGWGYSDIAPYIRRSEKFTPNKKRPTIDLTHRGDSGLWQTGYSYLSEIGEKGFLGACEEVGIPNIADVNTPAGILGSTRFQTFIDGKGQRSSAATAYLTQDVINRKNLDIAVNIYVTRILFEGTTAVGVEIQSTRDGPKYHVRTAKEVILCGGAINTPQTLKLSGIGPRAELEKHGIKVIKDSPLVGENLRDHFCTSVLLCKAKPGYTLDYLGNDIKAIPSLARWLLTGGGPVTSNVGEAAAFIRSADPPFPIKGGDKPIDYSSGAVSGDVELIATPLCYADHGATKPPNGEDVFSLVPIGLRPQSKGSITLASNNVFDKAIIDPKYWTDADDNDRKALIVGIRVCLKIIRSEALKKYLEPVEVNDDPESFFWPYSSSNVDAITDEQIRAWMGKTAFTLYHPVGTACIGPDAESSVLDLQCRVRGVENLRVVDLSVAAAQLSGHPTSAVIAIAEKMSDVIRGVTAADTNATKSKPLQQEAPLTSSHTNASRL
ncbi:hypothetical protein CBS101457_002897 [Exobasidium rhododendri]|nr:hypothetical protein CBS101457_002897 [Exobasidium rhododendri]